MLLTNCLAGQVILKESGNPPMPSRKLCNDVEQESMETGPWLLYGYEETENHQAQSEASRVMTRKKVMIANPVE